MREITETIVFKDAELWDVYVEISDLPAEFCFRLRTGKGKESAWTAFSLPAVIDFEDGTYLIAHTDYDTTLYPAFTPMFVRGLKSKF